MKRHDFKFEELVVFEAVALLFHGIVFVIGAFKRSG